MEKERKEEEKWLNTRLNGFDVIIFINIHHIYYYYRKNTFHIFLFSGCYSSVVGLIGGKVDTNVENASDVQYAPNIENAPKVENAPIVQNAAEINRHSRHLLIPLPLL